jgi:hypothetical protein
MNPGRSPIVANPCLKSWSLIRGSSASSAKVRNSFVNIVGWSAAPFSAVNMRPLSTHAGPHATRATTCCFRCARSAATVSASRRIDRPRPDFGVSNLGTLFTTTSDCLIESVSLFRSAHRTPKSSPRRTPDNAAKRKAAYSR